MSLRAVLLIATLALVGCRNDDTSPYWGSTARLTPSSTLYVNNGAEPEYLDPGRAHDASSFTLVYQLFEGLTAFHPGDLHPTQGVAERWERSDSGLVYRFHLRREARWSDGEPVTAGDFAYAWKRVLRPSSASYVASTLYPVLNAELFNLGQLRVIRRDLALRQSPHDNAKESGRLPRGTAVRLLDPLPDARGWARVQLLTRLPTFSAVAPSPPEKTAPPGGFVPVDDLQEDDGAVGVRAVDDLTLDVELEHPIAYFLDLTSFSALAPVRKDVVEAFERRGEPDLWTRPENIVVNGPYTLESWHFRDAITMKPNPYYWNRDKLKIKRVVWLEVESSFTTMNLYRVAQVDFLGDNLSIPPEYRASLDRRKDFHRFPMLTTYWYQFNVKSPPLRDVRVRRALNLAVDKTLLTQSVAGGGIAATHYVPDCTGLGYSAAVETDKAGGTDPFSGAGAEFDPTLARALLGEAGFPVVEVDGEPRARGFPPLEILYNGGEEGNRNLAVAIQDMWRRHLGIQPTLRAEEWKVLLKDKRDGNFQIVASAWDADYNHPHTFLDTFLSTSPQNSTGWASPEFDQALREAAAAPTPDESIRRYRRAEKLAVDGMARMPLYFVTGSTLVKPYLRGYRSNARNIHLIQYLWIDPDWQRSQDDRPAYAPPELPPSAPLGTIAP